MIVATELRLVLVTPETTLLDRTVKSIRFPLYDGQIGILPLRAPMVGRLGAGELRFSSGDGEGHYFIDGGFVQVKGSVVSILTHRALSADEINLTAAEEELASANALKPTTEEEFAEKARALQSARKLLDLARR